jgi:hypothetical protein
MVRELLLHEKTEMYFIIFVLNDTGGDADVVSSLTLIRVSELNRDIWKITHMMHSFVKNKIKNRPPDMKES